MAGDRLETTCCVVGGGPAGMMLGLLLARRGIRVTVLEKHNDFFRDFRGDTVHPSTLEVLRELDLLDEFLRLPHEKIRSAGLIFGDTAFDVADFRSVPTACKFVAMMPQWDFLSFLATHAQKLPGFQLLFQSEARNLLIEDDRVTGVAVRSGDRDIEVRADLVVGCDGRHSVTRAGGGFRVLESGVPIDVLWFRISRAGEDPLQVLGNVNYGRALILINRGAYFQGGLIIPKGSYDEMRRRGLDALRILIVRIAPYLVDRVDELKDWDQIKILTVQINRLRRWYRAGLLCIGDAAHAMSPAGGVGINLAIQDAVAAANLLAYPLQRGRISLRELAAVQRRREFPTRVTQAVQTFAHRGMARVFQMSGPAEAPWQMKLVLNLPGVHRALGYAVGVGARPEHVRPQSWPLLSRIPLPKVVYGVIGMAATALEMGKKAWHGSSRTVRPGWARY